MTSLENKYVEYFDILKKHGRLIDDWSNVYEHCLKEAEIAELLGQMLYDLNVINLEDKINLIKAAILHDWYKRFEIERVKTDGIRAHYETENESKELLKKLNISDRIIEIAHSVGSTELLEVENYDIVRKTMHFIDDICDGNVIVEIDERIKKLEKRYPELNESGRLLYEGKTMLEKQKEIGKNTQNELEQVLKIDRDSIVLMLKQKNN